MNRTPPAPMSRQEQRLLWILIGLATLVFLFFSLGWPVAPGRVYRNYLEHYYGLPTFDTFARSVGASYVLGWISQLPASGMEVAMLLLYLVHLLATYHTARLFGVGIAQIVTLVMIFHTTLLANFHSLNHAPLTALAVSLWSVALVRLFRTQSKAGLFFLGLVTFMPVLMRQTPMALLLTLVFPVVCFGLSRQTLTRSAILGAGFLVGLTGLLIYHHQAFNVWKLSSKTNLQVPVVHVLFASPKLAPEHGPKNRELLRLVQDELLSLEEYQKSGVTLRHFTTGPMSMNQYTDLIYLNHRHPGVLTEAVSEAIRARPLAFAGSLLTMTWNMYTTNPALWPPSSQPRAEKAPDDPPASELARLRAAYPEQNKSDLARIMIDQAFPIPTQAQKEAVADQIARIKEKFTRSGDYHAAFVVISFLQKIVPPMLLFLILTPFLLPGMRSPEIRLLVVMLIPIILLIFMSGLFAPDPELRAPFDFLIILGGVVGARELAARALAWGTR
ncbi:MAG: hypothetical protein HQL96_04680 [Magnetococcales bacterium]|nr:hypothetical protein [Magnetococcales bacterium]